MSNHSVRITFQGPDFSAFNTNQDNFTHEVGLDFAGYDLDYGVMTVYTNWEDGLNHTLAHQAPMCNEEGRPIGATGWVIEPSEELLKLRPDLHEYTGLVFGRVLVTAGGFAVDES